MNHSFDLYHVKTAEVLDRIIEAYGFSSKIMLAQHFNMVASSYLVDINEIFFPQIWLLDACMTGVSFPMVSFWRG